MTIEAALDAVDRRDPDRLADVLIDLSEKERRSLYPELMERTEAAPAPNRNEAALDRCFFISLWGTGTSRDVRNAIASWRFAPDSRLADVAAARPQKMVDAVVKGVLRDDWNRGSWFVVRDLVRRGTIDHPGDESYYAGLVRALPIVVGPRPGPEPVAQVIVERLRDDEALPTELLRALDFEEAVNWVSGPYVVDAWLLAFQRAVEVGVFDRDAILDLGLDGQLRDGRRSATAFFRKLFDRFDPTLDDKARRADRFVRIISASAPSEQAKAAKILSEIARAGTEVDSSAVASAVVTPLTGSHKGAAVAALRLLSHVVLTPAERAEAAVHGLGHPHPEVQEAALRLLEECELPVGVAADATMWIDAVVPSLRERLVQLLGIDWSGADATAESADLRERRAVFSGSVPPRTNLDELIETAAGGEMPGPLSFDPWALPDQGAPLQSIRDVDELVATLTVVLAGTGTPIDLERAIDGFARFDPSGISDAALSPVRATFRSETAGGHWGGWDLRSHVEVAARYWCGRTRPPPLPYLTANKRRFRRAPALAHDLTQPPKDAEGHWWAAAFDGSSSTAGIMGFVSARLWEAVVAGITNPRPSLALPTTSTGWLDDAALTARLAEHRELRVSPGRFDAIQALLRLRPGEADPTTLDDLDPTAVSSALARFRGRSVDLRDPGLERAVERTGQPRSVHLASFPSVGHQPELTVLRYDLDAEVQPRRRDDPVGQLLAELPPPMDRPVVNARWTPAVSALFSSDRLLVDWTVIGLPRHRDIVAARAAASLAEDLDANRSSDCLHALLSAASDPDLPLTFPMHVLLATGLADRNVVTSSAAADALHDSSIDGRLDATLLGEVLAELTNGGLVKPSRFAAAASAVVPTSAVVAERVRQVLGHWLAGVEGVPRDLHTVLETLELACARAGAGIELAAAREKLNEAAKGSSKRAKAAGRLLEIPGDRPAEAIAAAGHALIDRAERWSALDS